MTRTQQASIAARERYLARLAELAKDDSDAAKVARAILRTGIRGETR